MNTLTNTEIARLRDRGFKGNTINDPKQVKYWRDMTKLPLAWFNLATKDALLRECNHMHIAYRTNQSKDDIRQLLLMHEATYFRVLLTDGTRDALFPVHNDVTIYELIKRYNNINKTKYTTISYNGNIVDANMLIGELADIYKSIENNINNIIQLSIY